MYSKAFSNFSCNCKSWIFFVPIIYDWITNHPEFSVLNNTIYLFKILLVGIWAKLNMGWGYFFWSHLGHSYSHGHLVALQDWTVQDSVIHMAAGWCQLVTIVGISWFSSSLPSVTFCPLLETGLFTIWRSVLK